MTYYRVNARKAQSRNVRARAPSFSWKAHDDNILNIEAVAHPPSIISSSQDCLTKVWGIDGILLGVLDLNNPKPSKGLWKFKPETAKR